MSSNVTGSLRRQLHEAVDQLSDEDLTRMWDLIADMYYDAYMLQAVHFAKRSLTPGDSFTPDEALRFLALP